TEIANPQRKVVGVVGDGGVWSQLRPHANVAHEKCKLKVLVIKERGKGVIRCIKEKKFCRPK
ncbi:thiamine pyrophosphate-dependent enzyme, partial [Enterobacter hormaechei]